jgi:hypothetical protein
MLLEIGRNFGLKVFPNGKKKQNVVRNLPFQFRLQTTAVHGITDEK